MESVLVRETCRKCLMKWDGIDNCVMDLNDCWLPPKWESYRGIGPFKEDADYGIEARQGYNTLACHQPVKYRSIDAWKGSPLLFHQNWIVQCPTMFVASASSFSTLF